MGTKTQFLALALVLFLAASGVALANDGVELPRWALGGGVSDSAAGDITLRATLGQPIVGVITNGGGAVTTGQGFWHGATPKYTIYLPLIQR